MSYYTNNTRNLKKLKSAINLRDLGSWETARQEIFPLGQVLRSGSLSRLNQEDAKWICQTKLFRTYVDLRTVREIERDGKPEVLIANGINWLSVPVDNRKVVKANIGRKPKPSDYSNCYCQTLSLLAIPLRTLLELIADGSSLPIAFGCTAGKDRTGVIAALLLSAFGVSSSCIQANYALSSRYLRPNLEWFRHHWENKGISSVEYARRLEARPETIAGFLILCQKYYGSIDNLFAYLGIYPELIASAKDSLQKFIDS